MVIRRIYATTRHRLRAPLRDSHAALLDVPTFPPLASPPPTTTSCPPLVFIRAPSRSRDPPQLTGRRVPLLSRRIGRAPPSERAMEAGGVGLALQTRAAGFATGRRRGGLQPPIGSLRLADPAGAAVAVRARGSKPVAPLRAKKSSRGTRSLFFSGLICVI
jgi:hypothetical protein